MPPFRPFPDRAATAAFSLALLAPSLPAQSHALAQPTAIKDVRVDAKPDAPRKTLVLRDGRIEQVLEAGAALPPGVRIIDGKGQLAVPAFFDAFTQAGCAPPAVKPDKDVPVSTRSDVQVDMREANRKGIAPAFRAADVFELAGDKSKGYRESGFGWLVSAPSGELLSGTSVLATTREAAARDQIVLPIAFNHGEFRASGAGYPGTAMGFVAQLRQLFLDAQRQRELELRFSQRRPGPRPPFDAELAAVRPLLLQERRLMCAADSDLAIERWIKIADEQGIDVAVAGGRKAYELAPLLAARKIPVALTLDWGEEPKDPHEKEKEAAKKKEGEKKPEGEKPPEAAPPVEAAPPEKPVEVVQPEKPVEGTPPEKPAEVKPQEKPAEVKPPEKPAEVVPPEKPVEGTPPEKPAEVKPQEKPVEGTPPQGKPVQGETKPAAKPDDEKAKAAKDEDKLWNYEEPLGVREDKRRLWEEDRDCAMKLEAAKVSFGFGSGSASPSDLLKKVRTLVEKGLAREAALNALCVAPAQWLGLGDRVGAIAPGKEATFALWTDDPFSKDAQVAWMFVDGFGHEFEVKAKDAPTGKPKEGLSAAGSWEVTTEGRQGKRTNQLALEMSADGAVTGKWTARNPADDTETTADVTGHLSDTTLWIEFKLMFGEREVPMKLSGELTADAWSGDATTRRGGGETTSPFTATKKPKQEGLR